LKRVERKREERSHHNQVKDTRLWGGPVASHTVLTTVTLTRRSSALPHAPAFPSAPPWATAHLGSACRVREKVKSRARELLEIIGGVVLAGLAMFLNKVTK
jgi:hypothetical protein